MADTHIHFHTLMSHHHTTDLPKKKLHQDWRFITAVILMFIAMMVYIMTMDNAVVPGRTPGSPGTTMPAAPSAK